MEEDIALASLALAYVNTAALLRAGLLHDEERQIAADALDDLHNSVLRKVANPQLGWLSLAGIRELADRLSLPDQD